MKSEDQKEKTAKGNVVRSIDEFNKRFYPKPLKTENGLESPDPDDVAEKLARESLDRLQAVLSSK